MAEKTLDIFETLLAKVGGEYISDLLCIAEKSPEVIQCVLVSISPTDFPLNQWNDALDYLVKAPAQNTAEAAHELLCSALSDAAEKRKACRKNE